jgi:hypothetical protein
MEPIPIKEYVFDGYGTFDEEFEMDLKYDIQEIKKENEDEFVYDFEVINKQQNDIYKKTNQKIIELLRKLPEIISVSEISKVYYTVYTYKYVDNLVEYDNILEIYNKECEINKFNMSEQTKRNYQKRIEEYVERYKITKKIIVLENPVNICIDLDLTNNEICMYDCKSADIHKNIMINMTYVDIDVQKYVSDVNITYSLLYIIYLKKFINLQCIEEFIKYFTNLYDYHQNKKFTKNELHVLYYNIKNIIDIIKKNPVKYSLHS